MAARYDTIGKTYTSTRAADPRILHKLMSLLGLPTGARVIDIGAGTGNYSKALAEQGLQVQAVEPSSVMRAQASPHPNLQWSDASAEELPYPDSSFAGAVMTLCLHHMQDWKTSIREALRVSGGGPLVVFAFDIDHKADFWLFDYFPQFIEIDQFWAPRIPQIESFVRQDLGCSYHYEAFPLPQDLQDHFMAADWARPENYLKQEYRDGVSSFHKLSADSLNQGLQALEQDLASNAWQEKYGHLLKNEFYDRGYLFLRIGGQDENTLQGSA